MECCSQIRRVTSGKTHESLGNRNIRIGLNVLENSESSAFKLERVELLQTCVNSDVNLEVRALHGGIVALLALEGLDA